MTIKLTKLLNMFRKYGFVIVLLLILCILFYAILSKRPATTITLHNWYGFANSDERLQVLSLFETLFANSLHKFKEIRIYSVFGEFQPFKKEKGVLTVQYSGESRFHKPSQFDINIIPDRKNQENIVTMPYMASAMLVNKLDMHAYTRKRTIADTTNTKFCLFSVSNPSNIRRNDFFKALSKYKHVDSCGKVMNNLGYLCPGFHGSTEFHDFISAYKFMICFENSSKENYLTEKLLNAYSSGTIPIYWGCPNVGDYINMSSILYLQPNYSEEDVHNLIKEIELLDTNDELYKQKYESVLFKDSVIPNEFNIDKLRNTIDRLAEKSLTYA